MVISRKELNNSATVSVIMVDDNLKNQEELIHGVIHKTSWKAMSTAQSLTRLCIYFVRSYSTFKQSIFKLFLLKFFQGFHLGFHQ